jgi:CheY-like chemotaxis protein
MDNPLVILLVEDEVLVRMVAADVLEDAGFTVLESASAEEALRLLETRPDVQVLFTDVNMPGTLDGLGLAQTVHERSPGVSILIGSGRIRPSPGELPPGTRFIPQCLSDNKLNDLSDLCFSGRPEIGTADVDQREPRSLRPQQASLPQ